MCLMHMWILQTKLSFTVFGTVSFFFLKFLLHIPYQVSWLDKRHKNDNEVIEIAIESPNSYVNYLSNLMKILTK